MANKLNKTGLRYLLSKMVGFFALQSDLETLQDEVDELITEGGEPNVIESIKKNGTVITPDANKAVDIPVPTFAKSGSGETEKVTVTDGQTTYDVPTTDAMEDYVSEHGGVIQKIKQNGTDMSIDPSDKSVNFTNATTSAAGLMSSEDKTKLDAVEDGAQENVQSDWNQATTTADDFIKNKPTKLSDFTNDGDGTQGSTFPTTSEMQEAIAEQIGRVYKPAGSTTFENLPALTAANLGNVYNVTNGFTTTADFKEGAGVDYGPGQDVAIINDGTEQNPVYKYNVMSGAIDLSGYWGKTELVAITTAEIDEVWDSVFNPTTP